MLPDGTCGTAEDIEFGIGGPDLTVSAAAGDLLLPSYIQNCICECHYTYFVASSLKPLSLPGSEKMVQVLSLPQTLQMVQETV